MSYPTLLLHLDDDPRAGLRLEHAAGLAAALGSHLVGLATYRPAANLLGSAAALLGRDEPADDLDQAARLADERRQAFVAGCARLGVASHEALVVPDDDAPQALLGRGRLADLLLVGQPEAAGPDAARRRDLLDRVVLANAHPTLVVPHSGRFAALPATVLVAWDESREAARAVADAMPLLSRARAVHLVTFDPDAGPTGPIDQGRLEPARTWLSRHGIQAQGSVAYAAADIGNAILSRAADVGADLLVMGAWGQSRLAERVMGGATRTVLDCMTVPVLLSH